MPDHGGVKGVILPSQLCVRGLGSCAPGGGIFGAGREFSSMVFSGSGRIRVGQVQDEWSIRRRFTGKS